MLQCRSGFTHTDICWYPNQQLNFEEHDGRYAPANVLCASKLNSNLASELTSTSEKRGNVDYPTHEKQFWGVL
uniref:Uncharacterized protein n=1 Tax=Romanomermis culicivorax TaxID=13658 RepID=A0A915K0K0_ROMCU